MLANLKVPVGWGEIVKRTAREMTKDNISGWAAQLAYYFFLSLFPALLFLVALASFFPLQDLIPRMVQYLDGVVPPEVLKIITDQVSNISRSSSGGLLTIGILATIWSASAGMSAVIDTLNNAYDITEGRPWWRVRLTAILLTIAVGVFAVISFGLVLLGPALGDAVAGWFGLGSAFAIAWSILQWPIVFFLVVLGVGIVYYYAPDADQDWVWITPGSLLATLLWLVGSLGFRFYAANFGEYNATYGAIGGVIMALLWFYITGLAILVGAELNAEIEHASPYGKDAGEKKPGERKVIGPRAARAYEERRRREQQAPAPSPRSLVPRSDDYPSPADTTTPGTPWHGRRPGSVAPVVGPARNRPSPAGRLALGAVFLGEVLWAIRTRLRRVRG